MLVVTATALPRLLACNGSRLMGDSESPINTPNQARDEGNAFDWFTQQLHDGHLTLQSTATQPIVAPNGILITSDMRDHAEEFLSKVGQGEMQPEVSFAGANWKITARADHIKFDGSTLHVADEKYGWGIIEPEENWTLLSYAIGYCINRQIRPERVALSIYQPRPYHSEGTFRTWSFPYEELKKRHTHINAVLSKPSDMLNTGSQCKRCPALATCPAAYKAELLGLDVSESAYISEVTNDQLSFRIKQINQALTTLKQQQEAYEELALHRIKQGQLVKDFSAKTHYTNTGWKDYVTPELVKTLTGKDDYFKSELITPTQAKKKGLNLDVFDALTERRVTSVKLEQIKASDKANKLFNQPTRK